MKQALESFSDGKITLIAVIFQNTHEKSVMNSMRSLFSNHVSVDLGKGLKVSKFQDAQSFEQDRDSVR